MLQTLHSQRATGHHKCDKHRQFKEGGGYEQPIMNRQKDQDAGWAKKHGKGHCGRREIRAMNAESGDARSETTPPPR